MSVSLPSSLMPGKLYIAGHWQEAARGEVFPTLNPATEEVLTMVARAREEDVDRAVRAARQAFDSGEWSRWEAADRGRLLWRIGELVLKHAEELALLETLDAGKPIAESRQIDIPMVAELFFYYAGWATKLHGETIPVRGPFLNYTVREPVGVVAAITPWNFPLLLACWKIAPALAAGNTVIVKPSEYTPLSILRFAEIAEHAGVPPGVLNVLTGPADVGAALVRHPGVDKIAFTGSTATGRAIMKEAAETLKKVTLELGGKSPNLIFADADLDPAVRGAFLGIFYNNGQVCAAGSRLLVEESVHDLVMEKLLERARRATPGDPLDPKTRLGPLASESQLRKVEYYVNAGIRENATLVLGGERLSRKGYFFTPTIFDRVTNAMTIGQEEIFGPVLAVIPFKDVEEAVEIANGTIYGLAAGIWTRDVKKAHRLARALKAGTVWINAYNVYDPASPFGGYKMSGFGRELGFHALEHYTQIKSVWVNWGE
jgi:acyl-CoA reductase-like NAD-dependent aldehyde dehydrogenase